MLLATKRNSFNAVSSLFDVSLMYEEILNALGAIVVLRLRIRITYQIQVAQQLVRQNRLISQ